MARPLYKTEGQLPARRAPEGHTGLWFDKFCDRWRNDGDVWTMKSPKNDDKEPKLDWIEGVTEGSIGKSSQIHESAMRSMRLIERRGGHAAVFVTEFRFVTGLGRNHPIENGFAWHPTLGTPYLPGSSIKGLVRSWAELDSDTSSDRETVVHLLGDQRTAGNLCFLDALPVEPVRLEADVMTPHYAGWTEQEPPGDWLSPTPIPFLTTAAGTPFLFGIVPCRTVADEELETASAWLRAALSWAGAGAKTAVGYGRFRHEDAETTRWTERVRLEDQNRREERERQEAMRSPEGRWRLELKGLSESETLDLVRIQLEKNRIEDAGERSAFARAVATTGLLEYWRRGTTRDSHTPVGKKKLKDRARLLDNALGEGESMKNN